MRIGSKRIGSKKIIGGKVIGSGGFGCVLRPALKCKGQPRTTQKMISKLMEIQYAKQEYNEIMKYKKILITIPNYERYFLVNNITLCSPDKLIPEDLIQFNEKCRALKKKQYAANNVNTQLNTLGVLTIPDGGMDLQHYLETFLFPTIHYSKLVDVNNMLIDLLLNGIIKMNKKGILHTDIKDSNILMDGQRATIIDWGLSTVYTLTTIPEHLKNRQIYKNAPFTLILFNHLFTDMYLHFLKTTKQVTQQTTRAFVQLYVKEWIDYAGPGHIEHIKEFINLLFKNSVSQPSAMDCIVDYLTLVIITYTKGKTINLLKYFTDVFIHIIDVWGFLTIYFNVFEILALNYSTLRQPELKLYDAIKSIILTHMFEPRVKPNNIEVLVSDLKALNQLYLKCSNNTSVSLGPSLPILSTPPSLINTKLSKVQSRKLVKSMISSNKLFSRKNR